MSPSVPVSEMQLDQLFLHLECNQKDQNNSISHLSWGKWILLVWSTHDSFPHQLFPMSRYSQSWLNEGRLLRPGVHFPRVYPMHDYITLLQSFARVYETQRHLITSRLSPPFSILELTLIHPPPPSPICLGVSCYFNLPDYLNQPVPH